MRDAIKRLLSLNDLNGICEFRLKFSALAQFGTEGHSIPRSARGPGEAFLPTILKSVWPGRHCEKFSSPRACTSYRMLLAAQQ